MISLPTSKECEINNYNVCFARVIFRNNLRMFDHNQDWPRDWSLLLHVAHTAVKINESLFQVVGIAD